jgi:hypothetical protein
MTIGAINPISVVTYQLYDTIHKAVYEKNQANGNVTVKEEDFPLYNKKGQLVHSKQSTLDIKA